MRLEGEGKSMELLEQGRNFFPSFSDSQTLVKSAFMGLFHFLFSFFSASNLSVKWNSADFEEDKCCRDVTQHSINKLHALVYSLITTFPLRKRVFLSELKIIFYTLSAFGSSRSTWWLLMIASNPWFGNDVASMNWWIDNAFNFNHFRGGKKIKLSIPKMKIFSKLVILRHARSENRCECPESVLFSFCSHLFI